MVELPTRDEPVLRSWIVIEAGTEPYGCLEDPQLDPARYVYVEAGGAVLLALARGRRDWRDALADGSVEVFGDPDLARQLPRWFKSGTHDRPSDQEATVAPARAPARPAGTTSAHQR